MNYQKKGKREPKTHSPHCQVLTWSSMPTLRIWTREKWTVKVAYLERDHMSHQFRAFKISIKTTWLTHSMRYKRYRIRLWHIPFQRSSRCKKKLFSSSLPGKATSRKEMRMRTKSKARLWIKCYYLELFRSLISNHFTTLELKTPNKQRRSSRMRQFTHLHCSKSLWKMQATNQSNSRDSKSSQNRFKWWRSSSFEMSHF